MGYILLDTGLQNTVQNTLNLILFPPKNSLKHSRKIFIQVIQQSYGLFKGIQLTLCLLAFPKHES